MALTLNQIESRIRDTQFNIPKIGVTDLWDIRAKELLPKAKLRNLINAGIIEWSIENQAEKDVWEIADAQGDPSTLTTDQRQYGLPSDLLIVTDVRVDYDDSTGDRGSQVIPVDERFLVDENESQPESGLPERMFIWGNQFELDPIPDDDYPFRLFGYRRPSSLTLDSNELDTYEYAEECVFLKCREVVAREIRDIGKTDLIMDYERVRNTLKNFDEKRHDSVMIVKGSDYWT